MIILFNIHIFVSSVRQSDTYFFFNRIILKEMSFLIVIVYRVYQGTWYFKNLFLSLRIYISWFLEKVELIAKIEIHFTNFLIMHNFDVFRFTEKNLGAKTTFAYLELIQITWDIWDFEFRLIWQTEHQ